MPIRLFNGRGRVPRPTGERIGERPLSIKSAFATPLPFRESESSGIAEYRTEAALCPALVDKPATFPVPGVHRLDQSR